MKNNKQQAFYEAIIKLTECEEYNSLLYLLYNHDSSLSLIDHEFQVIDYITNLKNKQDSNKTKKSTHFDPDWIDDIVRQAKKEFADILRNPDLFNNLEQYSVPDYFFDGIKFPKIINDYHGYKKLMSSLNDWNKPLQNSNTMAHHMAGFLSDKEIQYFEEKGLDFWTQNKYGFVPLDYALPRINNQKGQKGFIYLLEQANKKEIDLSKTITHMTQYSIVDGENQNDNDTINKENKKAVLFCFNRMGWRSNQTIGFFHYVFLYYINSVVKRQKIYNLDNYNQQKNDNLGQLVDTLIQRKDLHNIIDFNDKIAHQHQTNLLHTLADSGSDWFFSKNNTEKEAISNILIKRMNQLIDNGFDPNHQDYKNNTFCHYLARGLKEQKNILIDLLEQRNDIDLNLKNNQNKTIIQSLDKRVAHKYKPIIENYRLKQSQQEMKANSEKSNKKSKKML